MPLDVGSELHVDNACLCADLAVNGRGRDGNTSNGLRHDDKPLRPWLVLRDPSGVQAALGISTCANPAVALAMHAVIANLIRLVQMDDADWIFYSRDNAHYVAMSKYSPKFYRRQIIVEAVDRLVAAGLVCHEQTRPSPSARYRSRLQPTASLRVQFAALPARATCLLPREPIVQRGEDGNPRPYRETAKTFAMRQDVVAHNAFLERCDITVAHPEARLDPQGFVVVAGRRRDPDRKAYHRVFNGRFTLGGRWYGPWWQSLPSRVRAGIRINGEPTIEPDIRGCHMRLLCARAGVHLEQDDPYALPQLPRDEVKVAMNMMLNARNWPRARGALIETLSPRHGPAAGVRADAIRTALQTRFPALEPFWTSGYGLTLQNIDAGICARLQRRLRDAGVPCLSIHDSFVVPRSAHDRILTVMQEEFDRACRHLRRQFLASIG